MMSVTIMPVPLEAPARRSGRSRRIANDAASDPSRPDRRPRRPPVCPNRTKVFHVKRFCPIDGLRKVIVARRRKVRFEDFARAKLSVSIKLSLLVQL